MVTTSLSFGLNLALSPFPCRSRSRTSTSTSTLYPLFHIHRQTTTFGGFSHKKPFLRGTIGVARFGLRHVPLPDPEDLIRDLHGRAEGLLYTIADAAVSASPDSAVTTSNQNNDWLSGIANYMETVLKVLKDGLSALHIPYSYGFAIILLTVLVKAATFPLSKKQVESAMAMRSLAPQIKAIQQRYAGDQERIQLETARLYKLAGINPLAGCLPTLATIPVWIGLYRALSNVADEGLLSEGFFWIPSLAGPTTVAARQSGSGISWLFPFVDGQPPLGWSDTLAYLVLPVLLVISQYVSVQIMQSSQSNNDPNQKTSQAVTKFLPLMIGYFALSVPSGLSLYWFTNNILSTAQQVFLQKFGGASNPMSQFTDDIVKEAPSKTIQSSISETITVKDTPKVKEKLTLEGPRPGERFKQLKEQEARRKQQREEEKRKAAAKGIQITKVEDKKEANLVEREDANGAAIIDANNSVTTTSNSNSSESHVVNGDSSLDSKEDQKTTSIHRMEKSEVSVSYDRGRDNQHLHENPEKDEAVARVGAAAENKLSGEELRQDRSE
ncbi:hypothetical protein LguiB_024704 [Lonicera macranthoides]